MIPWPSCEEYGADALRFTLAIQAVPGMDISLSLSRIKGYKAFANKLWNASRYVIMNLRGDESTALDVQQIRDTDRWILHRLNQLVEKINDLLDSYRLHEAADLIYHFVWDEYCDWYLEFSKNDLEHLPTRQVLKTTLFRILQLLHPFMPFITEEIYQRLQNERGFLVQSEFPQFDKSWVFPKARERVETLKKLVAETRKTRSENHIDPNRKVAIYIKPHSLGEGERLAPFLKYFDFLTRSACTQIVTDFSALSRGFKGVCGGWEILLPFDREGDRQQEVQRLAGECRKLNQLIALLEAKLASGDYLKRAPADVVQQSKKNLQDAIEKRQRIEKTIADLS